MKKVHFLLHFPLFLLFSILLGSFFLLLNQIPEYNIQNHSFRPGIFPFFLLCSLSFLSLLGLWLLYSKLIANLFSLKYSDALSKDFLSYLPIIFLLFTPLAISRYLSSDDLLLRIRLFSLAILFSFFYLKIANFYYMGREKPFFINTLVKKLSALSTKKKLILLFITALILYNTGSALIISGGIHFGGDEPHYLLISHSLLHDGDFNLSNNYANRDYAKYVHKGYTLDRHLAPRTKNRYSFHSPGTSLLLLPFYSIGSFFENKSMHFFIIRFGMSIFGALFGIQIFLYALQEWKKEKLALILWSLFSFTSPVFFYSIHIYPEIIAALFSFTLFRLLRFSKSFSKITLLASGFLISSLLWLHAVKYTFIIVPLFIYSLWVLIKKHKTGWNILYFLAFPFALVFVHALFSNDLYSSLSPFSVSLKGALTAQESLAYYKKIIFDIPFRYRWESLAGYFFDQRDGLLFYAPIYFFAFLGMAEMVRRKPREFALVIFLTAPYVLNLAFLTQRAAYAPQVRPLVAVFWGMAIFLGYFLAMNAKKIFSYALSFASCLSLIFVYLLLKNPFALYQPTTRGEIERAGKLFLKLSNLDFFLPRFLPSYIKIEDPNWMPNFIWIAILLLFIALYLVTKKHSISTQISFHVLFSSLGMLIFFFWIVLNPRTILRSPQRTLYPTGEKITFFSLDHSARMKEPGKFNLRKANQSYVFSFASWRELKKIQIDFGSLEGDYDIELKLFDKPVLKGITSKEIKHLSISSPPHYRYKKTRLYRVILSLKKKSPISTAKNPYSFSILPSY